MSAESVSIIHKINRWVERCTETLDGCQCLWPSGDLPMEGRQRSENWWISKRTNEIKGWKLFWLVCFVFFPFAVFVFFSFIFTVLSLSFPLSFLMPPHLSLSLSLSLSLWLFKVFFALAHSLFPIFSFISLSLPLSPLSLSFFLL